MDYQHIFEHSVGIQKIKYKGTQGLGCCPLHDDNNPSFSFNIENGLWRCFSGCGSGNLYQLAERLNMGNTRQYITGLIIDSNNYTNVDYTPKNTLKKENRDTIEVDEMDKLDSLKNKYKNQVKDLSKWIPKWKHKYLGIDDYGTTVFIYPKAIKHHKSKDGKKPPWWEGIKDKNDKVIGSHCQIFAEECIEQYDKDKPLYIVEGEKDWAICNLQCVTFSSGAGSVPDDLNVLYEFGSIIIVYDNDKAGSKGAKKVAEKIKTESPDTVVKIAQWDKSLPEGYDIIDDSQKENIFDELDKAIVNANEYELTDSKPDNTKGYPIMNIHKIKETSTKPPEAIVQNLLVDNGVTLISGTDGVGKTWFGLQMAVAIASGEPFLGWKVNKKPVLMIQFELSESQLGYRLQQFDTTKTDDNFHCTAMQNDDLIFSDAWVKIANTIIENDLHNSVVIVDNLYTSTHRDVSANHDLKPLLKRIDEIRKNTGCSFVLIAHHNKHEGDKEPILGKNIITGGKTLTNYVSNVFQIGISSMGADIRRGKITKMRDAYSDLLNEPLRLRWNVESCTFEYEGTIMNESLHCEQIKGKWEYKVLIEFSERNTDEPVFDRQKIQLFIEGHFPDDSPSTNSKKTTRWLNKMEEYNLIKKTKYNKYELEVEAIKLLKEFDK